jgi:CheY-like chemotaxis protein
MKDTVIVVEDDELIRESLLEVLEDNGYVAVGAGDGREALEKLASLDRLPCLIVLDLMMPGMDGREFRRLQLEHPTLKQIPVVVISAFRDLDEIAKEMAPAGHFKKPLKLQDFLNIVQTHCPNTHAERS